VTNNGDGAAGAARSTRKMHHVASAATGASSARLPGPPSMWTGRTSQKVAPSPAVLLVLRMIQGALTGTTFAAQALVAAAVPEKETARSMGLLQMSVFVGATFGPVGGGAVAQFFGYRAAFVGAGILVALATVVVLRFVHEPPKRAAKQSIEDRQPSVLAVVAIPAFAGTLVLMLITQVAATSLLPVVPLYVQQLLHGGGNVASYTGWLLAASGVTAAIGSYAGGRAHRHLGLKPLLLVSITLSAVLLVPQGYVGSYLSFLILRCVGAVAFGVLLSLVSTSAAVSSPKNAKGTAFGLMGAASSMGFGAGPLIGGAVAAVFGIRSVFLLGGGILALTPVVFLGAGAMARAASRLRGSASRSLTALIPGRER